MFHGNEIEVVCDVPNDITGNVIIIIQYLTTLEFAV